MTIDIHNWYDKIRKGLCPNMECDGRLKLVNEEGGVKTHKCAVCGHEVTTNYQIPAIEYVN
jgi:hypothetical protein